MTRKSNPIATGCFLIVIAIVSLALVIVVTTANAQSECLNGVCPTQPGTMQNFPLPVARQNIDNPPDYSAVFVNPFIQVNHGR